MSEAQPEASAPSDAAKKEEAVRVLSEVLERMGLSGSYDVKDAADGSISIAMTLNGELPGAAPGKRSHVVDSLQFLINKIVNRTPQSRRWVSLGLGEHPAPRQPKPQKQPAPAQPAPAAQAAAPAPQQQAQKQQAPRQQQQQNGRQQQAEKPRREPQLDESKLDVAEDAALAAAARELAEKSARHGRFMGLVGLSVEDRARVLKAVKDVPGVSVKMEGEGRNRRLSLIPEKPTPMPKQAFPVDDDEEDDAEE